METVPTGAEAPQRVAAASITEGVLSHQHQECTQAVVASSHCYQVYVWYEEASRAPQAAGPTTSFPVENMGHWRKMGRKIRMVIVAMERYIRERTIDYLTKGFNRWIAYANLKQH